MTDPVLEVLNMPTAVVSPTGVHVCAQLRIEASHLQGHGIGWAAKTMEAAARHIEALENRLIEVLSAATPPATPAPAPSTIE